MDWARYSRLRLDVFNPRPATSELGISLGGEPLFFPLPPWAGTTLSVPLHEPWEVTRLELIVPLGRLRPAEPTVLFLDNLRLDVKTLDDPLVFQVRLGPAAAGDRLLPSRPPGDLTVDVGVASYPGQSAIREVVARLGERRQTATFQDGLVQFRFRRRGPTPPSGSNWSIPTAACWPGGGAMCGLWPRAATKSPSTRAVAAWSTAGPCFRWGSSVRAWNGWRPCRRRASIASARTWKTGRNWPPKRGGWGCGCWPTCS